MRMPTEEDISRCVDIAFDSVYDDVRHWNTNVAGTPKFPWSERDDVEPTVEFSHRWWAIDTLYELLDNGFTVDANVLLRVQQLTCSGKITSD